MRENSQYSTDQNHIYTYFQCIEQLEPASVIDFGMFLHRMGAVSREAMSQKIGEHVQLWGIKYGDYEIPAVYGTIYNKIVEGKELCSQEELFELAVMMDLKPITSMDERQTARLWAKKHAKYLLTERDHDGEYRICEDFGQVYDFHVDSQDYVIVEIGR